MHRLFTYCFFLLLPSFAVAQGNLLITPMRVIFDGQKRMQELNLANTGADTARYLISFMEIRMNSNGSFDKVTEPDSGQRFASPFLRLFPRSVVLPPGEAQLVKVQLNRSSQLTDGEYRSHIYFRAVPGMNIQGEAPKPADSNRISVALTPVFGVSIPVIIRIGQPVVNVTLSDASVEAPENQPARLSVIFNRSGNHSSYGDVTIDYISDKGKVTTVCSVKGLAVYTPTASRMVRMELGKFPDVNYHKGKLKIAYTTQGKDVSTIAQTELTLQ
jgi:hypothetical protein